MTARLNRTWLLASLVLLCAASMAFAQDVALPRHAPFPGGVAVVKIGETDAPLREVVYGGRRVLTLRHAQGLLALVGVPLDAKPGPQALQIRTDDGALALSYATAFEVKPKQFPAQHLKINPRFLQPTAEELARIERERELIERARSHWSEDTPAQLVLDLPAQGPLSARFGLRRLYNGQEGAPHAGLDVAVGTGTPLRAAAAGRVIATGDYFYAGKTVFIDHGQGFITVYIHMSRIDVKEGDMLARAAPLGLSGATGRVTGPHLHWGVLLNGVYVDPELFLRPAK